MRFQDIFKYAGPVLVSIETMRRINGNSKIVSTKMWYCVLLTTRILLAHCAMSTSNDKELLLMIAHNLMNLYRLFGFDIAERADWVDIKSDSMHYKTPKKSRIYIDLPNATRILKSVLYKDVYEEFESECVILKRSIGDCMCNLLGKRKSDSENVTLTKEQSIVIDLTESDEEVPQKKPKKYSTKKKRKVKKLRSEIKSLGHVVNLYEW